MTTIPSPKISRYFVVIILMALLQMGFFSFYGYVRHSNYLTSIYDLGVFDQAVWGFLNGSPFLNTILFESITNWLGVHFSLIIAFFVPLYAIYPTVYFLIFAQAIALPLAALPLFYIAKKIFKSEAIACLWAITYMCNPYILNAASWDFHPVTLAVPLIALAFYALESKNFRLFLASCLLILLCKEHFGLLVFGFGLLWLIRHREFIPALFIVFLGLSCFVLIVGVVMPILSPNGDLLMMSTGKGQLSRYSWLGQSLGEIFLRFISDPIGIICTILLTLHGWKYLLSLAFPFLFFSVFELWLLLPGIADFTVNLLSANPLPKSVYAYHSATLVPILMVSAMHGLNRSANYTRKRLVVGVTVSCFFVSAAMGFFLSSFYPLPGVLYSWAPQKRVPFDDPVLLRVKELVGNRSASVQANLGAHFTNRMEVYPFPKKIGQADMIILNLGSPTENIRGYYPEMVITLAHHLQMKPAIYLKAVEELLNDKRYGVILWQAPWLVFEKDAPEYKKIDNIELWLKSLAVKWQ